MFVEMSITAEALGFDALPAEARLEFERITRLTDTDDISVLVSGDAREEAVTTLREGDYVESLSHLGETDAHEAYRLTWARAPPFVERLHEAEGTVLSGVWCDDTATLELRFPDHETVSAFYAACDDAGTPITLRHTSAFGVAGQTERDALTPKQATALGRALAMGYFDVPRRATLDELAREFGVSDSAISQRLRRGVGNVLRASPGVPQAEDSDR